MNRIKLGRFMFAFAMASIGFQYFLIETHARAQPFSGVPFKILLGFIFQISIIVLSLGILLSSKPRIPATSLGIFILSWVLFRHIPLLVTNLTDPSEWNFTCMALAVCGGAFIIAPSFAESPLHVKKDVREFSMSSQLMSSIGRSLLGLTLLVFGFQHLYYSDFIASLIPVWIPGNYFWAFATGIALFSCGISIILNLKVKWTTLLLGTMIFLWFILIHVARLFINPKDTYEWTNAFQALAISGSSFVLSGISNESHAGKNKRENETKTSDDRRMISTFQKKMNGRIPLKQKINIS